MKNSNRSPKHHSAETEQILPVHSLDGNSRHINILPLNHNNPYDYKREHRHTYFEMMFVEKGGGNQLIDFNDYAVNDNSCYIIFPQQVHLMNRKDSTGTIVQFTEERISSPELRSGLKHHSFKRNAPVIFENRSDLLDELMALLKILKNQLQKADEGGSFVITHLLQSLVSLALLNSEHREDITLQEDRRLLSLFYQLVEEHFASNKPVYDYVQVLRTTDKKLAAATKKYTGQSPLQLIHNRILLEAKRMLLFEQHSHKEIAFQLGFDSPASFSTFIKTRTGCPPSELSGQLAEIHK
jgi:AraC family transcriptional regulator, transcriptional activator of pobA